MKTISFVLVYLSIATLTYADNPSYGVQVLAARQYENAIHAYEKLKNRKDARIEKKNEIYFVRIGSYQKKTEALSLLKQLKTTYSDAFLIKCVMDKKRIVRRDYPVMQQKPNELPSLPSTGPLRKHNQIPSQIPIVVPVSTLPKAQETPRLSEIPKSTSVIEEDLLKAGIRSYHERKYESAVSSLSKYASLAPKSQQCAAALLIIGKSLEELKRPRSAFNIYSRIIEQYPDSPESLLCIVAMADIGVADANFIYPIAQKGAEYVRDPVAAYDTVLLKKVPPPIIEHIHYQKGRALWKSKRYEQARDTLAGFLKQFPNTAYRKEIIGMLKDSTVILIDKYNHSGDHISVANIFFEGKKNGWIGTENVDALLKSAVSLSYLGLHDASLNILNPLRKSAQGKTASDIDDVVAEIEKNRAVTFIDQPRLNVKWNQFQTGREYLIANNLTLAEKILSDLKNTDSDPFWSKLTDFVLEENQWEKKYQSHLGK